MAGSVKYIEPFVEHSFIEIIFLFYVKIIVFKCAVSEIMGWQVLIDAWVYGHSTISGVQREREELIRH